jgi:tetratricopeptide (TPR) repeat protein
MILLPLAIVRPSAAAEPIRKAFGQTLGERFDPQQATKISVGTKGLVFGFKGPSGLPVLSEFHVLVTPLSYRIYGIAATDKINNLNECQKSAKALFYIVSEKYAGEEYDGKLFELSDPDGGKLGWELKQHRTERFISVKCSKVGEISLFYGDNAFFEEAEKEQSEWDGLYDGYANGKYAKVLPRIRQLAQSGNLQAQLQLGLMYRYGHGIAQDVTLAETYYKRAAQLGYSLAQYNLGTLYITQKRYQEAESWLEKAAKGGNVKAQHNLGYLYDQPGPLRNMAKAFQWYQMAAEAGHVESQYNICHMYSAGDGVPQNELMAYMWCHIATLQGHHIAQENRDFIGGRMNQADISQAQEMGRLWLADHAQEEE